MLALSAAWSGLSCQGSTQSSSSTHFIVCRTDADCDGLAVEAVCSAQGDTAGFCVDPSGTPVRLLPTFDARFDGTTLDTRFFRFETGVGIRNGEVQAYTESPNNVFVQDGELVLVARHEPADGAEYTSGSIELIQPVTFGRIEASIKSAVGSGVKPVFWLLPADPGAPEVSCVAGEDCVESTWPVWGGLVILSGRADDSTIAVASYASADQTSGVLNLRESTASVPISPSISAEYHLYAIEWGPERIDWFVDDERVHSFHLNSEELHLPDGKNPFHQPFRIKLSLSVGGLVEDPVPSDYPREMRVRSLRVLQID